MRVHAIEHERTSCYQSNPSIAHRISRRIIGNQPDKDKGELSIPYNVCPLQLFSLKFMLRLFQKKSIDCIKMSVVFCLSNLFSLQTFQSILWILAPYLELVPMFIFNLMVIFTVLYLSYKNQSSRPSFIYMANLALADASVFVCLLVLSLVTKNWAATSSKFIVCWEQPVLFARRCSLEIGILCFCSYCSLISLTLLTVDRLRYQL